MDDNQFAAFSFSGPSRKILNRAKFSRNGDARLVRKNAAQASATSTVVRLPEGGFREDENATSLGSAACATLSVKCCTRVPRMHGPAEDFSVKIEETDSQSLEKDEMVRTFVSGTAPTQIHKSEEQMYEKDLKALKTSRPTLPPVKFESTESAGLLEGGELKVPPGMATIQTNKYIAGVADSLSLPEPYPAISIAMNRSNIRKRMTSGFIDDIEDYSAEGLRCPHVVPDELDEKKMNFWKQTTRGKKPAVSEVSSPPVDWKRALEAIRIMRTGRDAPVDLHGPQQLVDESADPHTQKFQVLVAAMISSQTRDSVTAAAMKRLHAAPGGLTVQHIAKSDVSVESLEELLKPVLFYRQKAKHLKRIAEILRGPPYCGSVPPSLDELMKLPGVGPKVGLVVLWVAFGMGEVGLIVDTNVRRVSSRLGWAPENLTPGQVREVLERWLPKEIWAEISFLFVGFGQQICKPVGPKCDECGLKGFCPSAFKCAKPVKKMYKSDQKHSQ